MTDQNDRELDPGAYIGSQPEREAETIPGGVQPEDERVAAYDSRPGVAEEPADDSWSEGQTGLGDILPQPAEFEPSTPAPDENGSVEDADETPTLGGPLPE